MTCVCVHDITTKFPRLSTVVRVNVVLNRTVVFDSDLRFDNLCGSHLQSQRVTLTLKMSKRPSTAIDVLSYRNNTEEIILGSPRK